MTIAPLRRLILLFVAVIAFAACRAPVQEAPPLASGTGGAILMQTKEAVEARAEAGDAHAQFELGAMYHTGESVPKDLKLARKWFEKSAAQGDSRSQFNLGIMAYTGEDGVQDYDEARRWFLLAAEQDNPRAQYNLGIVYYRGEGVVQDFSEALNYFMKAGERGFNEAQFNLGVMYLMGEGVQQDAGQSYAWFEAARAYGNPRAADALREIEEKLTPEQLTIVREMAVTLKADIAERVAALEASAR